MSLATLELYLGNHKAKSGDKPPVIVGVTPTGGLAAVGVTAPVAASGTLTSDNTNVSNNDTVTIAGRVYTYKTTLTAATTAYEVLIGADADASLLNLIRCLNHTGTPGTDYGSATPADPWVSAATSVTSHAFAVTARVPGGVGNAITTTEGSSHLSWGGATLSGGRNASVSVSATNGEFNIPPFDYQAFTYVGVTNNIATRVFKIGGASGQTVATLTYTYVAAGAADNDDIATITLS